MYTFLPTYEIFLLLFSTAGVHDVNVSLGLGSGNGGRRDSFDRNTSAFSPSMDYARHKWPQYGTLGKHLRYFVFLLDPGLINKLFSIQRHKVLWVLLQDLLLLR
jgi:hypothetical protein